MPLDTGTSEEAARALIRDLHAAADRARDERLRLAQAQKERQQRLDDRGGPAPVDQIVSLTDKIKQLDAVVQGRLDTLSQTEQRLDERTGRLEQVKHAMDQATTAFAQEVERAQAFKQFIDTAQREAMASAGDLADAAKQKLADCEQPIAQRLSELEALDRSIDQRTARMRQMHKQAADTVDKHLARSLSDAQEQAADLAAPIKAELDKHLVRQTEALEKAVGAKVAELDLDVEEALSPLTQRFDAIVTDANRRADELAQALPARLDDALEERIDALRDTFAKQLAETVDGRDPLVVTQAKDRYARQVRKRLAALTDKFDDEANAIADDLERRIAAALEDARVRLDEQADGRMAELESRLARRVDAMAKLAETSGQSVTAALSRLSTTARDSADQAEQDLADRLGRLRPQADAAVEEARLHLQQRIVELRQGALGMADIVTHSAAQPRPDRSPTRRRRVALGMRRPDPAMAYEIADATAAPQVQVVLVPEVTESLEQMGKRAGRSGHSTPSTQ